MESPLNQAHKLERMSERALRRGNVDLAVDHLAAAVKQLELSSGLSADDTIAESIFFQKEHHKRKIKLLKVIQKRREEVRHVRETMTALQANGDDPVKTFNFSYYKLLRILSVLENTVCGSETPDVPDTEDDQDLSPPEENGDHKDGIAPRQSPARNSVRKAKEYLEQMRASFEILLAKNRQLDQEHSSVPLAMDGPEGGTIISHGSDEDEPDGEDRRAELLAAAAAAASTVNQTSPLSKSGGASGLPALEDPDFDDMVEKLIVAEEDEDHGSKEGEGEVL